MKDDGKKSGSFRMGVILGLLIGVFSVPALVVVCKLFFGFDLLDIRRSFASGSNTSSTSNPSSSTTQQIIPQKLVLQQSLIPDQIKPSNLKVAHTISTSNNIKKNVESKSSTSLSLSSLRNEREYRCEDS